MISIEEAINLIKSNLPKPKIELRKIYDSLNYYLAQDVYSNFDIPYFDNSAMDGYAISLEDTEELVKDIKEKEFLVIGISQAGKPFLDRIQKGQVVQVNTGAKVPENTGSIIPLEDVSFLDPEQKIIKINRIKKKFQNIRRNGEEIQKNEILFKKGTLLRPTLISILLECGIQEVFVYKKPKVLFITTGNELISYQEILTEDEIQKGRILDLNSFLIKSYLDKFKIDSYNKFQIPDHKKNVIKVLEKYYDQVDYILITGGISVGPYDFVKSDVEDFGFQPIFWKVKQKPGKPFYFAKKEEKLLFGLPGNPVSSFICFIHYVLPSLLYFDSRSWYLNKKILKSLEAIRNFSDRDSFFTFTIKNENYIQLYSKQGSDKISSIAYTDGYMILKSGQEIQKDETIECYLWI